MENTTMKKGGKPIRNPYVVLREEFDDWAILFHPDTGRGFGLNPTGVYVWKLLDGEHSIDGIIGALCWDGENIPQAVDEHLAVFLEELVRHGLAGRGRARAHDEGRIAPPPCPTRPPEAGHDELEFTYEPPRLVDLRVDDFAARGSGECCNGSVASDSGCSSGGAPYQWGCWDGSCTQERCHNGNTAQYQCNCGYNLYNNGYTCGYGACDKVSCSGTGVSSPGLCSVGSSH